MSNQTFTIEQINSLTKEELKAYGISLSTKKEKSPEEKLKSERYQAYVEYMKTHKAQMPNASWICTDDSHKDKTGSRPASFNELPMIKHIIKFSCKATRYASSDLFVKHGEDMLTRKHVTLKWATENLDRATQEKKIRDVEKAERDLAKAKALLG